MNTVARRISVLGTDYIIRFVEHGQDEYMDKNGFAGYCDAAAHEITILLLKTHDEWKDEPESTIDFNQKCTLRHELTHAFLNESGLQWNSLTTDQAWAKNEEMVDWFAIQSPKIFRLFQEIEAL